MQKGFSLRKNLAGPILPIFRSKSHRFFKNRQLLLPKSRFYFCFCAFFVFVSEASGNKGNTAQITHFTPSHLHQKKPRKSKNFCGTFLSRYHKHGFFGKHLFRNSVFQKNVFGRHPVFFRNIPDFLAFFGKIKAERLCPVLKLFIFIN